MKEGKLFSKTEILSDMGGKHHLEVRTQHGGNDQVAYYCTIDKKRKLDI